MNDYGLDLHGMLLLEEYRQQQPYLLQLQKAVMDKLKETIEGSGFEVNSMESRIKAEASLAGKLQRKGHKYQTLRDITDILGVRIIMFYNEDVDRIASLAENIFEIDWKNSVDKRKMHQFDSFGYNSLHYICRMPRSLYYDENMPELNEIHFELQMRTALQHVWSVIQHDIGYKSEIETPVKYHRDLSRLAGMLELADNEFSRIRNSITDYRRRAQMLVQSGELSEVSLDGDTFASYLKLKPFDLLNRQIASITQAELQEAPFWPYLKALRLMGMETLEDVERLVRDCSDDAYQLALSQLGSTDIDILSETIGLQNLCIVHILKSGWGKAGVAQFLETINGTGPQNDFLATTITEQASRLSFMHK